VSGVSTLDSLGSDDRFLTYSLPVSNEPGAEKGPRMSLWASPSRLNFGHLRSSLMWGAVHVSNLGFQTAGAYHRTNRLSLNILWNPFPGTDLGIQCIWGQRINKDGADGTARQIQLRAHYYFLPDCPSVPV
jgi:hypothetical protein